ncbi:hypothetical protein CPC08DRAFT_770417 [Agrocybe pediades]|nr:hypothetical protein CPC08DRAFT_770417 [Agrocybe pediades]
MSHDGMVGSVHGPKKKLSDPRYTIFFCVPPWSPSRSSRKRPVSISEGDDYDIGPVSKCLFVESHRPPIHSFSIPEDYVHALYGNDDIDRRLADFTSWDDLTAYVATSRYFREWAFRCIRHRVRKFLCLFVPESLLNTFFDLLLSSGSVVAGAIIRCIMSLPVLDKVLPSTLDILVPTRQATPCWRRWNNFLVRCGYKRDGRSFFLRDMGETCAGYTVFNNMRLFPSDEFLERSVIVCESVNDCALTPLLQSRHTSNYFIMSPTRFYCFYPVLFRNDKSICLRLGMSSQELLAGFNHGVKSYPGTRYLDEICGLACPALWRTTFKLPGVLITRWGGMLGQFDTGDPQIPISESDGFEDRALAWSLPAWSSRNTFPVFLPSCFVNDHTRVPHLSPFLRYRKTHSKMNAEVIYQKNIDSFVPPLCEDFVADLDVIQDHANSFIHSQALRFGFRLRSILLKVLKNTSSVISGSLPLSALLGGIFIPGDIDFYTFTSREIVLEEALKAFGYVLTRKTFRPDPPNNSRESSLLYPRRLSIQTSAPRSRVTGSLTRVTRVVRDIYRHGLLPFLPSTPKLSTTRHNGGGTADFKLWKMVQTTTTSFAYTLSSGGLIALRLHRPPSEIPDNSFPKSSYDCVYRPKETRTTFPDELEALKSSARLELNVSRAGSATRSACQHVLVFERPKANA